jgi:hypothetical protein
MTATPRTILRSWIREQIDAGVDRDAAIEHAVHRAIGDDQLVAGLVTQVARHEASGILVKTHSLPRRHKEPKAAQEAIAEEVAALPADSPLAKLTPQFDSTRASRILVDLSAMTKPQVLNMAKEFEGAAQKNEELAAFCRAVADQLRDGQTVSEVFDRSGLLTLRSRITTHTTTRVFRGQTQIALTERTN